MKQAILIAALVASAAPALAETDRYTRVDFDFGKTGVHFNTTVHEEFCDEPRCVVRMVAAKMVLDYDIADETNVSIIPAHVVFTMKDGRRHPATGACVGNGTVITCALDHKGYGMELVWNTAKPKIAGAGRMWFSHIEAEDEFTFTWSIPKARPKPKADPKGNLPPS